MPPPSDVADAADANVQFLTSIFGWARVLLESTLGDEAARGRLAAARDELVAELDAAAVPMTALFRRHALTRLEQYVASLCLASAVDGEVAALLARLSGTGAVTPAAVARVFGEGAPRARAQALELVSPDARLRAARILDAGRRPVPLLDAPLELTRACLGYATGQPVRSPFYELEQPVEETGPRGPQQAAIHEAVARYAAGFADPAVSRGARAILLLLHGAHAGKTAAARDLASTLFGPVLRVDADVVLEAPEPARTFDEAFDVAALHQAAIVFADGDTMFRRATFARLLLDAVRRFDGCVVVTSSERELHPMLEPAWLDTFRITLTSGDRAALWHAQLPGVETASIPALAELPLDPPAIVRTARQLSARRAAGAEARVEAIAAAQLDDAASFLVDRLAPRTPPDALILPPRETSELRRILAAAAAWSDVPNAPLRTGRALVCLFAGEPGTGKSLAAEVVASCLGRSLHVVQLSRLQSKWLGETEKNVQDLFARARHARAVLAIDDADLLFPRRVDVAIGQDHAVNMLTGLFLQELDRHTGIVLLSSSFESNLDPALGRRLLYRLEFPMPDVETRLRLWRRLLPPAGPGAEELDVRSLAARSDRLSGGDIHNIIVRALLAARVDGRLTQRHLDAELGPPGGSSELTDWLGSSTLG